MASAGYDPRVAVEMWEEHGKLLEEEDRISVILWEKKLDRISDMVDGCTHGRSNIEWARLFFKLLNKDNFAHSHNCWVHQQFCWVHLATLLWFSLLGLGGSARELM